MTKWNDIPTNPSDSAEEKGNQFDRQWEENGGNDEPEDNNPYSKDNFNK
jgi:hypothetical protein